MDVAIVGSGMGGLALGRALAARGIETTILERRDRYARTGLGLLLLPNGLAALDRLGLGDEARERSNPLDLAVLRSDDGKPIAQFELDQHRGIARRELLSLLESGVDNDAVQWGWNFTGAEQDAEGVTVHDGERSLRCKVLIGADGARSSVRKVVAPDWSSPRCDVVELVSVCDAPELASIYDRTFVKHIRPGARLAVGLVPAAYGRIVWFVQFDAGVVDELPDSPEAKRLFVRNLIGDFASPVPDLVERTDFVSTHLWATPMPCPAAPLATGRIGLIGDAAHPFPTLTSQGANAAIADASILATHFDEHGITPDALASFAAARAERVDQIHRDGANLVDTFLHGGDDAALPMVQ